MSFVAWQQTVMTCLRELADAQLQTRAWLEGDGATLPSPVELVCQLFDDSGLDEVLDAGVAFSPECDAVLRKLSLAVAMINLEQPFDALLEDRAWHEIRGLSRKALLEIEAGTDDSR